MYFLRYNVFPAESHPRYEILGEALVCCWIERAALEEADEVARCELQQNHWRILARDSADEVTEADFEDHDVWRSYYEQALMDKEVYQYHLSPRHPVYWVITSVQEESSGEVAEAHYFLCGDNICEEDEDVYDPAFWTGEREETAVEGARESLAEAGWRVRTILKQGPCAHSDVPEDMQVYFDEAEEHGACLVFVHDEPEKPQ
jgi:exonuclease III